MIDLDQLDAQLDKRIAEMTPRRMRRAIKRLSIGHDANISIDVPFLLIEGALETNEALVESINKLRVHRVGDGAALREAWERAKQAHELLLKVGMEVIGLQVEPDDEGSQAA